MSDCCRNKKTIQILTIILVSCLLLYALGFGVWTIFYTETGNGDNVEHIHSTWLIAQGKVPYRDFFQHHNPLLWYIFSPLIKYITNSMILLDLAHTIAIITGIITFFVVYKICTKFFNSSSISSLLSLLILCPPYFYVYCFNYNPDTFMALFFSIGLFYLFAYWQNKRLFSITISFLSFFIAFLFTQKVLMILFVLGILCIFYLYKDKTPLATICFALILPLLGGLLFIAILYNYDALIVYFESNYLFNVIMQKYYGNNRISVANFEVLIPSCSLVIMSIPLLFNKENRAYKIIAILFVIELLLRAFYFSISPYYMLPLMICAVCLNSVAINRIVQKKYLLIFVFIALSMYYSIISINEYLSKRGTNRDFARYLSNNITPCDYILSSYLGNQSIISKDMHYYWAMLGHIDIAGEEAKISPKPNVNELVIKYKPKLIYGGIYWNSYYKNRDKNVYVQQVDAKIIDDLYLPTPFPDFYILKYEYHQKNCKYNKNAGEWLYAD